MVATSGSTPTRVLETAPVSVAPGWFLATEQWPAGPARTRSGSLKTLMERLGSEFRRATSDGAVLLLRDIADEWTMEWTPRAILLDGPPIIGRTRQFGALLAAQPVASPGARPAPLEPHSDSIRWIKEATELPQDRIARLIGVSRQALNLWIRGGAISDEHRRRLLAVRQILELAAFRHPTSSQLAAWLDTPRGADGRSPADLLRVGEFDRARYLAVSEPSPSLQRPPAWAYRSLRREEESGGEHVGEAVPAETDSELAALAVHEDDDEWETIADP